ncbi:MAG: hypothetical protein C4524_11095 [Candidatus Zixiibacteriota bacterium]|nr:MAG: hypothetical protein C4524_11095 [candidate division Zixibacteria bacterium]
MVRAWESRLNIALSHILNQVGVGSRPEQADGAGRKDVLIYHQGLKIVLEGSYDRNDAEMDARKRVEQLSADIAIAIHYPSNFPQDLTEYEIRKKLFNTKLAAKIILPDDMSGTLWEIIYMDRAVAESFGDWFDVDLNSLSSLIKEVAQFIINESELKKVEIAVEELVQRVVDNITGQYTSDKIAENIYEDLYKLYGFSIGDPKEIKEALFAQATLAVLLGSVYYESIRHLYRLPSILQLSSQYGYKNGLEEAVHQILKINYELIFDLVGKLLKSLPPHENDFKAILQLANDISTKRALLRRDLGGKVYHKVVGSWALKKGLATYYTQLPSAYLLLYLAKPTIGKVADFACGSGTLLVAAYSAQNSQHRLNLWKKGEEREPNEIEQEFHRNFINNCYAFDVLGYALQITILNLALHSPSTKIDKMLPSSTIPLGYRERDNFTSLGSLELSRSVLRLHEIGIGATRVGMRGSKITSLSEIAKFGPYDLIVMNPPFSRTTGRGGREGGGLFGFIGDLNERSLIKKDYESLSEEIKYNLIRVAEQLLNDTSINYILQEKDFSLFRQIWQAGEGLLFLYLANLKIADDGKICFVLPRSFISGVSWFLARSLILHYYHIEYIIVSYDSNEYNFSESSVFAECMFIAKKQNNTNLDENTNFIMLLKKPSTSIDAIALADVISAKEETYYETGSSKALVKKISRKNLIENCDNWGRFVYLPENTLLDQLDNLSAGIIRIKNKEIKVPTVRFNEIIATIGVDRKRFSDTFRPLHESIPGAVPMLLGGDESQRIAMAVAPNAYAIPLNDNAREMFDKKGSIFLVPDRIRITTAHVTALLANRKTIANIFYSVRINYENINKYKALCLWLNTTWGIMSILANRQETHGGFISMKMTQWRMMSILDIHKLDQNKVDKLAEVFDNYKHHSLARIPQQYVADSYSLSERYRIDNEFLEVFGVTAEKEELLQLYNPLSQAIIQWVGDS